LQKAVDNTSNNRTQTQIVANRRSLFGVIRSCWLFARAFFDKAEWAKTPDYTLSLERVKRWETDHGQIPPGAFVAMRSDWSKRWPDADKMANKDANGIAHHPGWSVPALKHLYEECKITASGHETTDTDPAIATTKDDYSLETYVLSTNHYQIELLTNLDKVPESGAIVVVSFPKPKGGSGFPARVFAILP